MAIWLAWARAAVLGLGLLLATSPAFAAAESAPEHRVALIIGNSAYRNTSPLANPANDATLMAETLSQLDFELIGGGPLLDADRPAMEQAIRAFGQALRGGAVGLFYYSGHGIQVKGHNFLIPVTAQVARDADVKYELVDVAMVIDEMVNAGNRLNIVILDACRNNPFGGQSLRALGGGLGQVVAPAGTVIAYATQPDNVASDGIGRNSPYTSSLAQTLRKPGLDLFATFNEVGLLVKQTTNGQQQPWVSASPIEGRFYFAGAPRDQVLASLPPSEADKDAQFWDTIKASDTASDFQDYLARFPEGQFAGVARRKLLSECDTLAAAPDDPDRTGPGVILNRIDSRRAIAACRAAPEGPRTAYLLGRAQEAAGSTEEAAEAYRRAAEADLAPAQAALGALFERGHGIDRDETKAAQWYRKAADRGVPSAQVALAGLIETGRGGLTRNETQAVLWYRKAAEHGNVAGQAALARMYSQGRGVAADDAEAARWARKAAEQGNADAQALLGKAYSDGLGVPRNASEAVRWYRLAAEQGNAEAQCGLGWSYQYGMGVAKNDAEAARWYRLAVAQGNEQARQLLLGLTRSSQ